MPSFDEARDSMLGVFKTKWDADTPAVAGSIPTIFYDGIGEEGEKPHDAPWARIQIRHSAGSVTGIGKIGGKARTTKLGICTVQVFTPLYDDDGVTPRGLSLNEELSKIAKAAFENVVTAEDVVFRNVRATEIGPDGPSYQTNVLAEFEYDEIV